MPVDKSSSRYRLLEALQNDAKELKQIQSRLNFFGKDDDYWYTMFEANSLHAIASQLMARHEQTLKEYYAIRKP